MRLSDGGLYRGSTGIRGPQGTIGATGIRGLPNDQVSNPNILINSNNKVVINQRGLSSVSGWPNNGNCLHDRWKIWGNMSLSIPSGVRLTVTSASGINGFWMAQLPENPSIYNGLSMTYSLRYKTNIPSMYTMFTDSSFNRYGIQALTSDESWHTTKNTTLVSTFNNIYQLAIGTDVIPSVGQYFEYEWIKLEEGTVATPYITPDPQQELARCQRYFQKFGDGTGYFRFGKPSYIGTDTYMAVALDHIVPMCKVPGFGYVGSFGVWNGGTVYPPTSLSWIRGGVQQTQFNVIGTGVGAMTACQLLDGGSGTAIIYLDAEL